MRDTTAVDGQRRAPNWATSAATPWLAGGVAVLLAAIYTATRNIYDDEVGSFRFVVLPLGDLWSAANATDVHPPGQYVLSKLFLEITGGVRSMTIGPLLFTYGGLAVFVGALLRGPALRGVARPLFVGVALLHPQILVWGGSIRWQSYWTGLALVVLTLGLSLHRSDEEVEPPPWPHLALVGLLLGAMLYLNYLTLLLIGVLSLGWMLRYRACASSLVRLALPLGIAGLLFVPQIESFLTVHLGASSEQTVSPINALLKLVPGAVVGQAMLPWHPIAPLFGLMTLPFLFVLMREAARRVIEAGGVLALVRASNPAWIALLVIYGAVFVVALATGLGRKPRNFVFLAPLFAYLLALAWQWTSMRALRFAALALSAAWIGASGYGLLTKSGASKGGLNDRYDEVLAVIGEPARAHRTVLFTHDPALAFAVNEAAAARDEPWIACSVAPDWYHGVPCSPQTLTRAEVERLVLVDGYVGSFLSRRDALLAAQQAVLDATWVDRRAPVSRDPDAAMKRRLPGRLAALCPDYRFTLYVGRPRAGLDASALAAAYREIPSAADAALVR